MMKMFFIMAVVTVRLSIAMLVVFIYSCVWLIAVLTKQKEPRFPRELVKLPYLGRLL